MRSFITSTRLLCLAFATALTGCGTGIMPRDVLPRDAMLRDVSVSLSALTSVRKHDCFATTLQLGVPLSVNPSVESYTLDLVASSGVSLYRTLAGCQSVLSSDELSMITLSNADGASTAFYARTTTEESLSITATARTTQGASSRITIPVSSERFTRTDGPNGAVYSVLSVLDNGQAYFSGSFSAWGRHVSPRLVRVNTDGTADTSFQVPGTGLNSGPEVLVVQPDGNLLVGGGFTSINGVTANYVARLTPSGSIDPTFATTGTGLNGAVYTMALASDGTIYVGGTFTSYNGTSRPRLARLLSNGSLDPTFVQTGTGLDWSVWKVLLQPDGKLLVGGAFFDYNSTFAPCLARVNADGSLDTTFVQTGSGLDGDVFSLVLQNDGRILVGGYFYSYNGPSKRGILRLNSNGSLDSSFSVTGTGLDYDVQSLALQTDGKVVVGGSFSFYDGISRSRALRLNSDGTLDATFALAGTGFNAGVTSVALDAQGGVFVAGQFSNLGSVATPNGVVKLTNTGAVDSTFIGNSIGFNSSPSGMAIQADGKILIGANTYYSYDRAPVGAISRLLSDGSIDTTFAQTGTGLNGWVKLIRPLPNGQILVAGYFTSYNGIARNDIARLNADGTLDTSFATTGTGFGGVSQVLDIAVQTDGKIIVGGVFTSYNGTSRGRIARLNSDGSLDTTFVPTGTGFDALVTCLAIQPDGKVIAGGMFLNFNGTNRYLIARLNSDGSLDPTFTQTGSGLNSYPAVLSLLPSGQLYVGGVFTSYNGTPTPGFARFNSDGSLDSTFVQTGSGISGGVFGMARQEDGKILVSGITGYNGTSIRVARINSDGSLDPTFTVESPGLDDGLSGLALQSDWKVLIYGGFRKIGAGGASYLARLTSDGKLD
jgi:uncharacterized delta-60 repeat protein